MGDNIDIDALREENLKNVEVGVDGSTHTYYINGVPYQPNTCLLYTSDAADE